MIQKKFLFSHRRGDGPVAPATIKNKRQISVIPSHLPSNWIQYWDQDQFWTSSDLWKINARLFFDRFRKIVNLQPEDEVLNIGCGPGHLEALLAPRVKNLYALDTSLRYVEMCKKNCARIPNVTVRQLGENYTYLGVCKKNFSLFLLISVVQYYRNIQEFEKIIESAKRIALPKARLLVADIPVMRTLWQSSGDAFRSMLLGLKEGYLYELFKEGVLKNWMQGSGYRSFNKTARVLTFYESELNALMKRLNLTAVWITESLTLNAGRLGLLIHL